MQAAIANPDRVARGMSLILPRANLDVMSIAFRHQVAVLSAMSMHG
jgi:hypothetical protein